MYVDSPYQTYAITERTRGPTSRVYYLSVI